MPLARIREVCDAGPAAAAVELRSYWRQVEADTRARGDQVRRLVDALHREDPTVDHDTSVPALDVAARRHVGLVREHDEDAVHAGTRLLAVADGFGSPAGHVGDPTPGARASATALAALAALAAGEGAAPVDDPVAALARGVSAAADAVRELDDVEPAPGPGSTVTAVLFSGHRLGVAHVGDTRLYRLRDAELALVTHDHTYAWSLVDEGRLTPEEAASHPERATLLRALHGELPGEPDLHLREARAGDRYLLCSDGLHAVVAHDELRRTLAGPASPAGAADELVDRALAGGAPDNVAVVVLDVGPGD